MNEIKRKVLSTETGKASYVKPTMQMYEMEVENGLMVSASDGENGGDYESSSRLSTPANRGIWDSEETV